MTSTVAFDTAAPSEPEPAENPSAGTLLYLPGATAGTTQWRAETLQVVNWGGFAGRVTFDFHPDTTLISGATGAGKSTLLDAYTALMMDANTPFNGASNDTVRGRARGAEQRNLLTYLRGQTDMTIDEETGREKAKTLRGTGCATWGAVAMTFVNDRGHRLTALRAYYVPATAVDSKTITTRMLTYDDSLDLAELAGHVESRFAPKQLELAYPGMRHHGSYQAFSTALFSRLGIGAHGGGDKALKLLTWIQSGHQIRTVDELFKNMVLEVPETYAQADRAIAHFDDLEASYAAMVTEKQKLDLLAPIGDVWQARERARIEIETLDSFGLTTPGETRLTLWSLRTHQRLLDGAVDTNRTARDEATDHSKAAERRKTSLEGELTRAHLQHAQAGGDILSELKSRIGHDEVELEQRRGARATLEGKIASLATSVTDDVVFAQLAADGRAFTATLAAAETRFDQQRDELGQRKWTLLDEQRRLKQERASHDGREGRVDSNLNTAREAMAHAAGLTREQVPFIAELIDIAPEHEHWRTAAEAVLAAAARTILVPAEHLEHFSTSIDSHRIGRRVHFEGVTASAHSDALGSGDNPTKLVGKLLFKDSPYSTWVHDYLSAPARNPLCIHDPVELSAGGHRVLPSGQTRVGPTRGSHGINTGPRVIGFTNIAALSEIDSALDGIADQLAPIEAELAELSRRRAAQNARAGAYEALSNYTWTQVNVAELEEQIAQTRARMSSILEADDTLRALAEHISGLETQTQEAVDAAAEARRALKALGDRHEALVEEQDHVTNRLIDIDGRGRVILTDAQTDRLDRQFADVVHPGDPADLSQFATNQAHLLRSLTEGLARANEEVNKGTAAIESIFGAYKLKWPDPNLGRSIESYPDYAGILQGILDTGLHARQQEWRARLAQWSGEDLVPLAQSMESAIKDIDDRMEPVNHILSTLPFGPTEDRLSIHLRRLAPEHITKFRKQLKILSGTATRELNEADMEKRFRQLQTFIGQIRDVEDPRGIKGLSDRHRLLDVRKHVEITAERRGLDGSRLSTLRSLGGKSGGESQEPRRVHRRSCAPVPPRRRGEHPAHVRAGLPRRGVRQVRRPAHRTRRRGLERSRISTHCRRAAGQVQRPRTAHGALPGDHEEPEQRVLVCPYGPRPRRHHTSAGTRPYASAATARTRAGGRSPVKSVTQLTRDITRRLERTWPYEIVAAIAPTHTGLPAEQHDPPSLSWPHRFPLGRTGSADLAAGFGPFLEQLAQLRQWATGQGVTLTCQERRVAGTSQLIPTHATVPSIETAAAIAAGVWPALLPRARTRARALTGRYPHAATPQILTAATRLSDLDFDLLQAAADWFTGHPGTGLTPRQVPVEGLHAKWLNTRRPLVAALAGRERLDLLPAHPARIHFTYLDPAHRAAGGRVHDSATVGDAPALAYRPRIVIISENKDTAIHFPAIPGGISIEGVGKGGGTAASFDWVHAADCLFYWGDMDIDGLEILDGFRAAGLGARSLFMDIDSYERWSRYGTSLDPKGQPLAGRPPAATPHLTANERALYTRLCDPTFIGPRRVEQERIPLAVAANAVQAIAAARADP